ncbi:MAG: DHH family phosphoesterase, partial [Gammaproteobacteria bacterium]
MRIERRIPAADAEFPDTMHPVLQHIYAARKIKNETELNNSLTVLHDYHSFSNMDSVVALLAGCLKEQQRILIIGDFDADGATSSALGVRALRKLGAQQVDYLVPNRFEYGYGLTPEIVTLAKARKPDLIITVDNGISSLAGVAAARAAGIRVLVTDHHLPG